jgi:hypothetical protein
MTNLTPKELEQGTSALAEFVDAYLALREAAHRLSGLTRRLECLNPLFGPDHVETLRHSVEMASVIEGDLDTLVAVLRTQAQELCLYGTEIIRVDASFNPLTPKDRVN